VKKNFQKLNEFGMHQPSSRLFQIVKIVQMQVIIQGLVF